MYLANSSRRLYMHSYLVLFRINRPLVIIKSWIVHLSDSISEVAPIIRAQCNKGGWRSFVKKIFWRRSCVFSGLVLETTRAACITAFWKRKAVIIILSDWQNRILIYVDRLEYLTLSGNFRINFCWNHKLVIIYVNLKRWMLHSFNPTLFI